MGISRSCAHKASFLAAVHATHLFSDSTRAAIHGRVMYKDDLLPPQRPAHTYTPKRKPNPRRANGSARDAIRARWRAIGDPCHLCGKPINYELGMVTDKATGKKRPHPMSFVVDEIVPVSKGGSPLDFANTRPAHWVCNARRGDGTKRKATIIAPLPQPFDE